MRTIPDAALLPLMPPDMLGEFIGDGCSIDLVTGAIYPPSMFPRHISSDGRGHYGGARIASRLTREDVGLMRRRS